MNEPIRHEDSARSRRKVRHQNEVIISEMDALLGDFNRLKVRLEYIHSKALKLQNRLREII
jgi:hypothetical protein